MGVYFAPQYRDPNEEFKRMLLQVATMFGGKKRETGDIRDIAQYGQHQQQLSDAETLQQSLLGMAPEARQQYQGPVPQWPAFEAPPQMRTDFGVKELAKQLDPLYQAQTKYYRGGGYYGRRKPTPSPIMKMVNEGLLTKKEGKGLARKEKDDDLGEKDIISIMHTIERALASTYTVLNEPIAGAQYAKRRQYYTEQLEVYRQRLEQLRRSKELRGEPLGDEQTDLMPPETSAFPRTPAVAPAGTEKASVKPKEYPDAVWSPEHGMWVVERNGRLMGVK